VKVTSIDLLKLPVMILEQLDLDATELEWTLEIGRASGTVSCLLGTASMFALRGTICYEI
jgi:hypothetical protein